MNGRCGRRSQTFPSPFENLEVLHPLLYGLRRPVNHQAGRPLQTRDVIIAEWLFLRSPLPEAVAQLGHTISPNQSRLGKQQKQNHQIAQTYQ
jgi:hypothetical protein